MPIPRSTLSRTPLRDLDLRVASGVWPNDLEGEIFISTSGQDTSPSHAFFGDGYLARLSLRPGAFGAPADRFAWRTRLVDTPSARLRAKRPDVFTSSPIGTNSPFGCSNSANTAPLPWGDRLFATWDAGRPVEVDPVTMAFLGEVGHQDDWTSPFPTPVLPMILSTAHPMIDPDRDCLWTVAVNPLLGQLDIIRYDGSGTRVQRWPVRNGLIPQSMHTIAQTRDWLILVDCAFRADPAEIMGGERSVLNNQDQPVYLVRKDALEATPVGEPVDATVFRVGPEVMHYYAAYDDSDGIRVLFEHTVDTDLAYSMRADDTDALGRPADPALAGMYNHPMHASVLSVLDFDPATGAVLERSTFTEPDRYWGSFLSAIDWSAEGMAQPTVHHMTFHGFRPEAISGRALAAYGDRIEAAGGLPGAETPSRLATLERDSLKVRADHEYPLDDYPSSPCFVPRDAGPGGGTSRYAGTDPGGHDGYVVLPVLNDDGFRVEVFDAADVGDGPVVTLASSNHETVPFLLHSAWMPRAVPAPDVERLRFADDLDTDRLGALAPDLAAAVHEVAAELG